MAKNKFNYDVCPYWLAPFIDNPIRRMLHNPKKLFEKYVTPGMSAMDLGCGPGYFSLGLAQLVESQGKVYSVDLQTKMLAMVGSRAKKAGLDKIITPIQCTKDNLNISVELDFALTFWMLHEVPNASICLNNIYNVLKKEGYLYIVEPGIHVVKSVFQKNLDIALAQGFKIVEYPKVKLSYAVVLQK